MGEATQEILLGVRDLSVNYLLDAGAEVSAVRAASFHLAPGEIAGLLGESGSGKTTTALALLRLLPPNARIVSGVAEFRGRDLLAVKETELEDIRGAEISVIFQEPGISLHPVMRVGDQVADVIRVHRRWSRARCREAAEQALAQAQLADTARIYSAYPHQLSGGQRQRVLIALALACQPALVIADEPTASLDATIQAEILQLLKSLKERLRLSILFISHNPGVLAQLADRVLVMYAGRIIEEGPAAQILGAPRHPYTAALLRSTPPPPAEGAARHKQPLLALGGATPDLASLPRGCAFEPRCPDRMEICTSREPEEVTPAASARVRCFKYGG